MLDFKPNEKEIEKIGKFSIEEKNFRIENLKNFNSVGFPNKLVEDWKFSDLRHIVSKNFAKLDLKLKPSKEENFDFIKDFEHNYIVLVNGRLTSNSFQHEDNSQIVINPYLNKDFSNKKEKNPLINLNYALSIEGFNLEVKDNYKFNKVLVIYNLFTKDLNENILNSQNRIKIGKNSELHVFDYVINKSEKNFFNNVYEDLYLAESSVFKNISIQKNRSNGFFHKFSKNILSSKSNYSSFIFPLGLKFDKLDLEFNLEGENIECNLQAASFLNKGDHQEIKTRVNHLAPNCKSYQKVKNVIDLDSKGVYQGKIFVKNIAQKTDAYQLSKAILLDESSEFDSKPELEIYADDVKCSHGSTSGSVEKDSIYYLMTRGLSKNESVKLLINGFLSEIIVSIKSKTMKNFIEQKLLSQIYEH